MIIRLLLALWVSAWTASAQAQYFALSPPFFCEDPSDGIRLRYFLDLDVFKTAAAAVGIDRDGRGVAFANVSGQSHPVHYNGICATYDPRSRTLWYLYEPIQLHGPALVGRGSEILQTRYGFWSDHYQTPVGFHATPDGMPRLEALMFEIRYRWWRVAFSALLVFLILWVLKQGFGKGVLRVWHGVGRVINCAIPALLLLALAAATSLAMSFVLFQIAVFLGLVMFVAQTWLTGQRQK